MLKRLINYLTLKDYEDSKKEISHRHGVLPYLTEEDLKILSKKADKSLERLIKWSKKYAQN